MRVYYVSSLAALAFLVGATAGEELQSGPEPGKELPGSFHVRNLNGPEAGNTLCMV